MTLLRWLTFLLGSLTVSLTVRPAFLDLFISSDTSICSTLGFPPLGNSDHLVSVSIDFPSNSQEDALFHRIAYDYSVTIIVLLLLLVNLVSGFRLELIYIYPS